MRPPVTAPHTEPRRMPLPNWAARRYMVWWSRPCSSAKGMRVA